MARRIRDLVTIPALVLVFGVSTLSAAAGTPVVSATAKVTVNGAEQYPGGTWDNGDLTITFNGYTETVHYGQFSDSASLAAGLAAMFWRDYHKVGLYAKAGADQNQDLPVITFQLTNGQSFGIFHPSGPSSSFSFTPSGFGSTDPVIDTGTVVLQVAGSTIASANYGGASTSASIAQDLAAAAQSNNLVAVTAAGANLTLNAKQAGSSSNYSYKLSATSTNSAFPSPSFATPALSGSLSGGADQSSQGSMVYSYSVKNSNGDSGYDAAGNIVHMTDSVMGTWSYGYDSLNRLTTGSANSGPYSGQYLCWGYDSFGNRQHQAFSNQPFPTAGQANCQAASGASVSDSWANYDANNHITSNAQQIGGVAGNSSTWPNNGIYDLAGDVVTDGSSTYLYDAEGRVCATHGPQGMIGYQYNAEGNRVGKGSLTSMSCDMMANGYIPTNDYVLDQSGGQMTEMSVINTSLVWQHTNVMANGMLVATFDTTGTHFYLNDALGTRRAQTNGAGVWEQNCQSLPFGDQLNCTVSTVGPTEHHFTGKERDTESGLDYFGARYYASNMGRWMSPDWADKPEAVPYSDLANPQSLNLYGYVNNNPLSQADPDGHCCWNETKQWVAEHPRTSQAVTGLGKVAVGVGLVGTIAGGDVPGGVVGAGLVVSGTISAVSSVVSGVTDVVGAATRTDVQGAQNALDSVGNGPALVTTAATGNPTAGAAVGTLSDAAQLGMKPQEALKNPATMADAAKTVSGTVDLGRSAVGAAASAIRGAMAPTPSAPPAPRPPPPPSCQTAGACHQ